MIFTFYSYKGGVGRTMALANIAELFYQAGLRVLMVDWDLEAPGLERFFQNVLDPEEILDSSGIIDMLLEYKKQMAKPRITAEDREKKLPFENLEQYLVPVYSPTADKGKLWLLPAGRRYEEHFTKYANAVLTFDWTDFYQNWEGERYLVVCQIVCKKMGRLNSWSEQQFS
jgi:cellulose biosynthesis protein BcsQ